MDCSYIVNPNTKRKVPVQSKKGISIVAGYLNRLSQKDSRLLQEASQKKVKK